MRWPTFDMEQMIVEGLIKLSRGNVISKSDIVANPGNFPIYSSARLNNGKFGEYSKYMFDKELITWSVDGGGYLFYRPKHKFSVTNVAGVLEVIEPTILNCKYLHYVLRDKHSRLNFDWSKKAHPSIIRRLYKEIPLPPIDDQKRIAHLLGKVEGLIARRKQHLQQLDDLLKSIFLEMFGDPVRNEKGWEKKPFFEILEKIESGNSPKCEARPARDGEWGILKLGAITRCEFNYKENKALPSETEPCEKYEIKLGDLLFSRKNTYDLVAACAYVFESPPKLLMPDLIFRLIFKSDAEVNPIYIWKLLINDSQRKIIQSYAAGAAGSMPNISKEKLKKVNLPKPPIALQNQFAAIVEKVESIKSRYSQSLTDLESLYGALSQKAFRGELDLSRVPIPDTENPADEQTTSSFGYTEQPADKKIPIQLPVRDFQPEILSNPEKLQDLLVHCLESYCGQLGNRPFSADKFFVEVQMHIAESKSESEFEPTANDYDVIKDWVFKALAAGKLKQVFNDAGNRIELITGKV